MAPVAEVGGGRHHDFSPKAQLQGAVLLEGAATMVVRPSLQRDVASRARGASFTKAQAAKAFPPAMARLSVIDHW